VLTSISPTAERPKQDVMDHKKKLSSTEIPSQTCDRRAFSLDKRDTSMEGTKQRVESPSAHEKSLILFQSKLDQKTAVRSPGKFNAQGTAGPQNKLNSTSGWQKKNLSLLHAPDQVASHQLPEIPSNQKANGLKPSRNVSVQPRGTLGHKKMSFQPLASHFAISPGLQSLKLPQSPVMIIRQEQQM